MNIEKNPVLRKYWPLFNNFITCFCVIKNLKVVNRGILLPDPDKHQRGSSTHFPGPFVQQQNL